MLEAGVFPEYGLAASGTNVAGDDVEGPHEPWLAFLVSRTWLAAEAVASAVKEHVASHGIHVLSCLTLDVP